MYSIDDDTATWSNSIISLTFNYWVLKCRRSCASSMDLKEEPSGLSERNRNLGLWIWSLWSSVRRHFRPATASLGSSEYGRSSSWRDRNEQLKHKLRWEEWRSEEEILQLQMKMKKTPSEEGESVWCVFGLEKCCCRNEFFGRCWTIYGGREDRDNQTRTV